MKRYLFELTAWLPLEGVERRSNLISDQWLADQLRRDPNLDRIVELVPDYHPLNLPPMLHTIAVPGQLSD